MEGRAPRYELGERVIGSTNGTGYTRPGFVTARLDGAVSGYLWGGEPRYMIQFDGDRSPSGPCVVVRAEAPCEDALARKGTGS